MTPRVGDHALRGFQGQKKPKPLENFTKFELKSQGNYLSFLEI